jgi:glycosyltransferase involved in cell wall biosynthesis
VRRDVRVVLIGGGVHPIPPTGYGGTERFIADLATALRAAGHDARVVNQVRHRRQRDEYPFAWHLPRLLREEPYDVLHANSPVVGNRLAGKGLPYVYTTHSRHWFYRERWTHRVGYWLERRAVRKASAPIALTDRLATAMRAAVGPTRRPIEVIPFGVDTDRLRPDWSVRTGTAALGVGVVAPFKRWELAATALAGSGVRLTIVGPVADPAYGRTVRAIGDHVALAGEVSDDDLVQRFARSDFLVHPSGVELLPGAVIQGLAAGLPVLGGPALDGLVENDRTGWVVPDADRSAFVRATGAHARALKEDAGLRRRMGDAARASAEARFAWPSVVARYVAVYRAVAGN